jgi:ADP-heptose:LPS heptosyltransferase
MTDRPKLLVARIGAIGDICLLIPLVDVLSRHYEVHWLIRRAHAPLLDCFPFVACRPIPIANDLTVVDPLPPELVAELDAENYACLIDFSHWPSVRGLAAQLRHIPVRATTLDPAQDALLGIPQPGDDEASAFNVRVVVPPGIHQTEKWRHLVQAACDIDVAVEWPLPSRPPLNPTRPLRLLVHPHAGKPEKIWPADRFARVVVGLARDRQVHCSVNKVGSRTMRALRWRLLLGGVSLKAIPQDPTFRGLHDALSQCDLAIGCDSGPMHFASLVGVPTLVIYGRYPAAEFGPLWRSAAVSPPLAPLDADAVAAERVSSVLDGLLADLTVGRSAEVGRLG